jgi:hypothetical protein
MEAQACDTEPLDGQSQTTDETPRYESSEADDSSLLSTPSAHNTPFALVEYHTNDSIAEQLDSDFINMDYFMTGSPTPEFPSSIYYDSDSWPMPDHSPCLYESPRIIHDDLVPFFLSYHRQNINYGRYFWYCDHHQFIKEGLLDLAKQSNSLQYAIAAFAALIYSNQVDHHMKKLTFVYYSKAIQELQPVINNDLINSESSVFTTIATILELASVEVRPCTKGLMIASYCRSGQMFSPCQRRSLNLSKMY